MEIQTFTYGKLPIQAWEYPAFVILILLVIIVSGRIKRVGLNTRPEYRYFLLGMWAKIGGGLAFAMIYVFYYGHGDTISYYECSLAFVNLLFDSPSDFLEVYFGPGTVEMKSIFNSETGSPMGYMFFEDKTRMVIKLLVPFLTLGMKSFFLGTVLVAIFTYGGLWRLYLMFTSYFPQHKGKLAIAILFMPSVAFWGSGILKDSFTLAATCYFIVATNDLIQKKGKFFWTLTMLLLSGWMIISIKPYILIILLPGTLVWYFYDKIKKIRNKFFRYIIVPFTYAFIAMASYYSLTSLGSSLGKFSPENALNTAVVIQRDLKQEYYEGNSFDIGYFEATPISIASKFPQATMAGLYRPFLWESNNVVMLISGVENLVMLILTIILLFTMKLRIIIRLILDHPIILYSFLFSVFFAFMIGVTTSNFGALVRFKIPLIPLYMGSLMVMYGHMNEFRIKNSKKVVKRFR